MLHRMLTIIHSGQFQSQQELAAALKIPPGLVLLMLEQLVTQGYLQTASDCLAESKSGCNDCTTSDGCILAGNHNLLLLTEKGKHACLQGIS